MFIHSSIYPSIYLHPFIYLAIYLFINLDYDTPMAGTLENNGHGIKFAFSSGTAPTVTGGRLGTDV